MKLRDIRSLVNVEAPARSVADKLARTCHSVDDIRTLAAKRLPRSIFDYLDGGAEDEVSLRRNRSSFDDWSFVPRWGAIENLDLSTTVLGKPTALPLVLAPTGGTRLFHPDGEVAVARAALAAGIPYGLAHLSTTPMESVSAAAPASADGSTSNRSPIRARCRSCSTGPPPRATRRCWSTSTAEPSVTASATTATVSPHRQP